MSQSNAFIAMNIKLADIVVIENIFNNFQNLFHVF